MNGMMALMITFVWKIFGAYVLVCLLLKDDIIRTSSSFSTGTVAAAFLPSFHLQPWNKFSTSRLKYSYYHRYFHHRYYSHLSAKKKTRRPKQTNTANNHQDNINDDTAIGDNVQKQRSSDNNENDPPQDTVRVRIWRVLAERLYKKDGEITVKQLGTAVGERRLGELKAHLKHVEKQAQTLQNKSHEWKQRRGLVLGENKNLKKLRLKQRKDTKYNEIYIKLE